MTREELNIVRGVQIDYKTVIANIAMKELFSRDTIITLKDDTNNQRLQNILNENMFWAMNKEREIETSMVGETYVGVEFRDGMPRTYLCSGRLVNQLGRVSNTNQIAVVHRKQIIDQIHWEIREFHTQNDVTRQFLYNGTRMQVLVYQASVPKELQLPDYEYHGLGKLMITRYQNLPATRALHARPDTAHCGTLPEAISMATQQCLMEMLRNKTTIYGTIDMKSKKELSRIAKRKGIDYDQLLASQFYSDVFLNVETGMNNGDAQSNLKHMQGNFDGSRYIETAQSLFHQLLRVCGYGNRNGTPDATAKTATEIISSQMDGYQTTMLKKGLRLKDLRDTIESILLMDGKFNYRNYGDITNELTIDIRDAFIQDDIETQDKYIQAIDAGIMSRVEAISKSRNISIEEATTIMEEIDAQHENDPFAESEADLMDGEDNGGNTDNE